MIFNRPHNEKTCVVVDMFYSETFVSQHSYIYIRVMKQTHVCLRLPHLASPDPLSDAEHSSYCQYSPTHKHDGSSVSWIASGYSNVGGGSFVRLPTQFTSTLLSLHKQRLASLD